MLFRSEMDLPEMSKISSLAGKPPNNKIPIRTWAKPFICESQNFFKKAIWVDADAVPIRPLSAMKAVLDSGEGFTTMNWPWGADKVKARELYAKPYRRVFGEWTEGDQLFAERTNVNAGILGWVAGESRFLYDWADTCRAILSDEEAVATSLCRDQTGLAILRANKPDIFPINGPKEWNFPANGIRPGDKASRKKYSGTVMDIEELCTDHPDVVIVHWLGTQKP